MEQPFFSVIIPVYEAEKYLRKAIDSIRMQTFTSWELVLVDDESKDDSWKICQEYAKKDERILAIRQEQNLGANAARKRGLEQIHGKYVTFMDADDYIEDIMYADIFSVLMAHPAQLTVSGAIEEYYDKNGNCSNKKTITPVCAKDKVSVYASSSESSQGIRVQFCKDEQECRESILSLEKHTLYGYFWNKFYEVSYLKAHMNAFRSQRMLEDAEFNLDYAQNITTMNLVGDAYYHYCKRCETSLTTGWYKEYYEIHRNHVERLLRQQESWNLADEVCRRELAAIYARYICSALERNCEKAANMTHKDRKEWIRQIYSDVLYEDLIAYGDSENGFMGTIIEAVKSKSTTRLMMIGRAAYLAKHKLPGVFAKLRRR